jgi:hypothetical protein
VVSLSTTPDLRDLLVRASYRPPNCQRQAENQHASARIYFLHGQCPDTQSAFACTYYGRMFPKGMQLVEGTPEVVEGPQLALYSSC